MVDDQQLNIQTTTQSTTTNCPSKCYTSVVFVHGMGQQRRHESICDLLEELDTLAYKQYGHTLNDTHQKGNKKSALVTIEPCRVDTGTGKIVAYQQITSPETSSDVSANYGNTVRFYEAYWAQHAVDGTSARSTVRWALKQWRRPLQVLFTPWGEIQQIRLGTLVGMHEACSKQDDQRFRILAQAYNDFCNGDNANDSAELHRWRRWFNLSPHPPKKFAAFLDHLAECPLKPQKPSAECPLEPHEPSMEQPSQEELQDLANTWLWRHRREQLFSLFAIFALLLTLGAALLLFASAVYSLGSALWIIGRDIATAQGPVAIPEIAFKGIPITSAFAVLACMGLIHWLSDPLKNYLGDVQQYVTYQETDAKYQHREAILDEVTSLLRHVLADDACKRVVVVAHSLGTVIAYDALLQLDRRARIGTEKDCEELSKITHFVTMGSPIDKVEYFFAAVQSHIPRYVKVSRQLRGDMSSMPFTIDERPHVQWINYWDQGDIISSPIRNVVSLSDYTRRVENVRIASYALIPEPTRSHSGYFTHVDVLKDLLAIIVSGKRNKEVSTELTTQSAWNGTRSWQWACHLIVLLLPWFGLSWMVWQLRESAFIQELTKSYVYLDPHLVVSLVVGAFVVIVIACLVHLLLRHSNSVDWYKGPGKSSNLSGASLPTPTSRHTQETGFDTMT